MKKIIIIILLALLTAFALISCENVKNVETESSSDTADIPAKDSDSLVYLFFTAYINNEYSLFEFRVGKDNSLYKYRSRMEWDSRGVIENIEHPWELIKLNEDEISYLKSTVDALDNYCMTSIAVDFYSDVGVPYIYMKLNSGYEGRFIYGHPDNKAFDELVTFCINKSSYEIKNFYGSEFKPFDLSDMKPNSTPYPCFRKNDENYSINDFLNIAGFSWSMVESEYTGIEYAGVIRSGFKNTSETDIKNTSDVFALAQNEHKMADNETYNIFYDRDSSMWCVSFFQKPIGGRLDGGTTDVYINDKGITLLIVAGE